MPEKILIIVPCFNEEASLPKVLQDVQMYSPGLHFTVNVAVINDCSTDRTIEIARQYNAIVLDLPVNLGIGGAVQTGFKYALKNGYDLAIQMDGDGQHPAAAIATLLEAMKDYEADVVIGSRYITREGFQSSTLRRWGIRYFKRLNRLLTGHMVYDSTSGFRCINRKAITLVSEYYPDEYPEPEILVYYALNGLKTVEIPVSMKERQGGISSIRAFSSLYYMCKVTLSIFYSFVRLKLTR